MRITIKVALLLALVTLSTGCGRKWEQLWGQDTKPEKEWIPLVPNMMESEIISDRFFVRHSYFAKARYLTVYACDAVDVCLPLPQCTEEPLVKQATYLVDKSTTDDEYTMPGLISFFNLKTKLPWAIKVRIEYVL